MKGITCYECKFFNVDDKDGCVSTGYYYCELNVRTPHEMTGKTANLSSCSKIRYRIKCNCPYNLEARKSFYKYPQYFIGDENVNL